MNRQLLISEHSKRKSIIKRRLKEFARSKSGDELFLELCFCLCTPQSNAKSVAGVINESNLQKLKNSDIEELREMLRKNTRFHNNKARYIVLAREFLPRLNSLPKDTSIAREYLISNIKGLGLKEASHYLRNIGYRDLCIIDRHVISIMHQAGVFAEHRNPRNSKEYLEMEKKIKAFAKKLRMDVDEFDLLMWSMKTGFVFR